VILRVAQTDPVRLQANVAEIDLARIKAGNRLLARDPSGSRPPLVARVTSIAPTVDPATRTGIVEAVVPNADGRFLPGQFINVDISIGRGEDALRVPLSAVHTRTLPGEGVLAEGARRYVWLAEGAGTDGQYTVMPVDVETGLSDGENIQIVAGLEAGQKVVVLGGNYLKRGDTVFFRGNEVAR
jgi:RND family efflux transporter MFP subunit